MNAQKLTTSIRLDAELIDRLDVVALALTAKASGATVNRSSAARVALERGLALLEEDLGVTKKRKGRSNAQG